MAPGPAPGAEALTADLTQAGWRSLGYPDIPIIDPSEAGRRLAAIGSRHDLTLFEYFFTDEAGHSQSMARAGRRLADLDGFFGGLLETTPTRKDVHSLLDVVPAIESWFASSRV